MNILFPCLLIVVTFATDGHPPLKQDATVPEIIKYLNGLNERFGAREYVCNWFSGRDPNSKPCWIVGQKQDRNCNVQQGVVYGNTFNSYKPFLGGNKPHFTFYSDKSCKDEVFDQDLGSSLLETNVQTNGCSAHFVESHCVNHC
jgi:hypothetical protein